jgi:hypothetical protein
MTEKGTSADHEALDLHLGSYYWAMTFSFIHAADLHIGSPFVGIAARDPKLAERLATASRDR